MNVPIDNRLRRSMGFLALLGFVSQYPIPVLHQCPVINPVARVTLEQTSSGNANGSQSESIERCSDLNGSRTVVLTVDGGVSYVPTAQVLTQHTDTRNASGPHQELPEPEQQANHQNHEHHEHHALAHSDSESGHDHDGCPVCRGYLLSYWQAVESNVQLDLNVLLPIVFIFQIEDQLLISSYFSSIFRIRGPPSV